MSAEPESRPVDNGAGDPKDDTGDKEPKKDDRCGRARARGVLAVRERLCALLLWATKNCACPQGSLPLAQPWRQRRREGP